MKKDHVVLAIFAVILSLALPTIGQGATLVLKSGEFTISGNVSSTFESITSSNAFGPLSGFSVGSVAPILAGGTSLTSGDGAAGAFVSVKSHYMNSEHNAWESTIDIHGEVYNGMVDEWRTGSAVGNFNTTKEIRFQVTPESGEHVGDLGTIYLAWGGEFEEYPYIYYRQAYCGVGPTLITVGGETIYSNPWLELHSDGQFGLGYLSYPIRIGDIIGVTMNATASLTNFTGGGPDYFYFREILTIEMFDFVPTPAPLPSTLLCLGSGLLGLAAWKRSKER